MNKTTRNQGETRQLTSGMNQTDRGKRSEDGTKMKEVPSRDRKDLIQQYIRDIEEERTFKEHQVRI